MTNNFTTNKIDFLHDIDKSFYIDKSLQLHYLRIKTWEFSRIITFIEFIPNNEIFTVFPFISDTGLPQNPYLRLSDHFLVTNKSNPKLISDFLDKQWNNTDFSTENCILYFKIRRITISKRSF
jgi:hypothetical protein